MVTKLLIDPKSPAVIEELARLTSLGRIDWAATSEEIRDNYRRSAARTLHKLARVVS